MGRGGKRRKYPRGSVSPLSITTCLTETKHREQQLFQGIFFKEVTNPVEKYLHKTVLQTKPRATFSSTISSLLFYANILLEEKAQLIF